MVDQRRNEKVHHRMTHSSPYPVNTNVRCSVRNSPKEMYVGRSEYMLDRFSSKSTATRWLLITRMPCPKTFIYINSPKWWMSTFLGELESLKCHHSRPSVVVKTTKLDLQHVECRR